MLARVVTAIVALGVVIAGVVLWRVTATSRIGWIRGTRWVAAVLAAYGAVAFVYAAVAGVPAREALRGHGLLQGLPYVLQGAFIGGFVLLPLGWIFSVISAGRAYFQPGSPRALWHQAVVLTACMALVIAPVEIQVPRGNPLDPQARITLLDRSLRALEDGNREIPRDTWDLDYVVRMVGRDPQRLFAWVRDNTYWIPYHGVLRGPVGVLMDRRGNSLDRAILLAVLLQEAGRTVRLAHGDLPRDQALELLPRLEVDRSHTFASDQPSKASRPDIRLAATQYQLDAATINNGLQSSEQIFAQIAAELRSRVADQTDRLLKLVAGSDAVDTWARSFGAAMAALSDHWWVQLQNGSNWVDLDLFAPNGSSGMALVTAQETPAIRDLPAELHHTVTLRVVAEQWSGGALREHKVLEHALRPSDLIGHSVMLQFWPSAWMKTDDHAIQPSRASAVAQEEWDAILAVDRNVLEAGLLLKNGDDPDAPVTGGELGGLAGAFASTMGLNPKSENRQLSAVWIDYEIHVPGEKPRVIRRTVFDLLGPAARATTSPMLALDDSKRLTRSLSLTMKTEILPVACSLSPEFVTALLAQNLLTDRDLFTFLIRGDLPSGTPGVEQLFSRSEPPLTTLYALALARLELSQKGRIYIDRPNILSRHLYPVPSGEGIAFADATDIVANEVGVGLSDQDPFRVRLAQGILDTNAESLFQPARNASLSAGDAFAASRAWMALASEQDMAALTRLALSNDVRHRIRNDLNAGYAVVAPERVVSAPRGEFVGWWRIDRKTGDALGVGANGWGATAPEYGTKTAQRARIAPTWRARIATFRVAFVANYGWCFLPLIGRASDYHAQHPHLGHGMALWEGAVKPSVRECLGDSIFIAGLTAWLLPVGVAVGASRTAGRGPRVANGPKAPPEPPTAGSTGGKGGGKGGKPTRPGSGSNEPGSGPSGEPNPDPNPKPKPNDDPCPHDSVSPEAQSVPAQQVAKPPAPEAVKPPTAQEVVDAYNANNRADSAEIGATRDLVRYRAQRSNTLDKPFYDPTNGGPADYNPNVEKQLEAKIQPAEQAADKALRDYSEKYSDYAFWNPSKNPFKEAGVPGGVCGPGPVTSLDPSLYQAPQSGNTQPGIGPSLTDPNGPPTVRDPRVQIPGDSNNPFETTQPGDNPFANTQPVPNSSGQTPSGQAPQSWDSRACPYCSTVIPVYPDSSSSDSKSQSNLRNSGQQTSSGQNTMAGLGGVMSAMGGGSK